MNSQHDKAIGKWQQQIWVASSCFCFFAFLVGTIQIFAFPLIYPPAVPALILVIGLGLYTTARAFYSFRWYENYIPSHIVLGTDIAVCIFLVITTGGIYSPFIAYTLVPVATAGLFLHSRVTLGIAILTAIYILVSHIWNPFIATHLSLLELGGIFSYWVILSFVTTLTFLFNVSLKQQFEFKGVLLERHRLSHEIHDGIAQIVSTLRWQVQFIQGRLMEMNIKLDEVKQLTSLIEKLHINTRECLKFLRNDTDKEGPLLRLEEYKRNLGYNIESDILLHGNSIELHPETMEEAQIMYICREALTNIRKHSGANETQIKIKSVNNRLMINITDNGHGFDTHDENRHDPWTEGFGLEVMRERAESIGGSLSVVSMPGQGTEIQVEIPKKALEVHYDRVDKSTGS